MVLAREVRHPETEKTFLHHQAETGDLPSHPSQSGSYTFLLLTNAEQPP
jgi:hypothetical protein